MIREAKHLILLLGVLFISCTQQPNGEDKFPENLFSVIKEGELKEDSYTFCGVVPTEIEYSYKVGKWTFKSIDGKPIAQGEYGKKLVTIDTMGGCSFSFKVATVDYNEWQFWNADGEKIKPTDRLKTLINLPDSTNINIQDLIYNQRGY